MKFSKSFFKIFSKAPLKKIKSSDLFCEALLGETPKTIFKKLFEKFAASP